MLKIAFQYFPFNTYFIHLKCFNPDNYVEGCYTIKTIVSAPVHKVIVLETHSVRSCLDFCKGFTYFGLTVSTQEEVGRVMSC